MIGEDVYSGKDKATSRGLAALLLSTTALAGMAIPALAVDTTWTGAAGTDWFTAGNWDTGGIPTNADDVFINTTTGFPLIITPFIAAGGVVTLGGDADGALFIVNANAELNAIDLVLGVGGAGVISVANFGALNVVDAFIIGQSADGFATVSGSAVLTVGGSTSVANGNGTTGSLTFAHDATGTFNNDLGLVVGNGGDGTLAINTGADVDAVNLLLGVSPGSTGTANIDGAGSTLDIGEFLIVGYSGTGTLNISNMAAMTVGNNDVSVGENAGSIGVVMVSADASLTAGGALIIGNSGTGTLNVFGGGDVVASQLNLGNQAGGSGTATVTDGASLTTTNVAGSEVGGDGTGNLIISAGGMVTVANALRIGDQPGGSGAVMLTGGGSILTVAGEIRVGDNGTGTLDIENGGVLDAASFALGLNNGATGTATISGVGSSVTAGNAISVGFFGNGTLTVADGASLMGDALILGGVASGSGTVSVSDAVLVANNSATIGFSGAGMLTISDAGALSVNAGAGTLGIGQNAGASGVLNIGAADADPAAAAGALVANTVAFGMGGGRLVFNHTDANYNFDEEITGTGGIFHRAGVTELTGTSNAFAGTTVITGGSLNVSGTLGGTVDVNGGTLGGSGTLTGALTVASGGNIAPGNSIGTLNVADITINAGSTHTVELNDGGFVAGTNNDLINATGAATINGGTVHVTPENGTDNGTTYTPGAYTIMTAAGGVTGAFDTISDDYAFLNFALGYNANTVFLTSSVATTFCLTGMTANQCATGDGTFSLGSGSVFDAVLNLSNAEAPGALDQLSGEIHASAKTALIEDSRFAREAAINRLRIALGNAGADESVQAERQVSDSVALWGQGFGSWGDWASDGNAAAMDRAIGGFLMGGDAMVTDSVRLGLMGGYSRSGFGVGDRMSSGSADTYTLGAYGGGEWDAFLLKGGAAYSWHSLDTSRSVAFTGFSDSLSASFSARTIQAYGEAAYGIDAGPARFEPFANLAYVNLSTDGSTENGGAAALTSTGDVVSATFTTLGLRAESTVALGEMNATLRGMLGWRHAFGDTPTAALGFAAGGDAFTVAGVPIARDALVLEAGFDVDLTETATLGLSYDGQFGSGSPDQGIRANLAVEF